MMQGDVERVAITLNVAPTFEERVVDWLLERDGASGFTSYAAYGHGARQGELSVAEQVSGRQRRIEFRIELPRGSLESFTAALATSFAGTDLYFFVSPLLRSGHLRDTLPALPASA
jgi:hypothetical protein